MRKRWRVLIVDDDDDVRETIAGLLLDEGLEVSTAVDGLDAIERLAAGETPDVILLDLMMPRSDGYDFRARQRADARLARVPVIAMTASGRSEARLGELAAEGFLRKPFEFEAMLALIDEVARRLRAAGGAARAQMCPPQEGHSGAERHGVRARPQSAARHAFSARERRSGRACRAPKARRGMPSAALGGFRRGPAA